MDRVAGRKYQKGDEVSEQLETTRLPETTNTFRGQADLTLKLKTAACPDWRATGVLSINLCTTPVKAAGVGSWGPKSH